MTALKQIFRTFSLFTFLAAFFLAAENTSAGVVYSYAFDNASDPWNGWYADNGTWEVGVPTAGPSAPYSPDNCAGTVLGGKYAAYSYSTLISPVIDLTAVAAGNEVVLRAYQWCSYYNEPHTSDDRGILRVRIEGQSTWDDLNSVFYSSSVWSPVQADLTAYAGLRIRIGFYHQDYHASGGGQGHGWYIDDVTVVERRPLSFNQNRIEDFESGWYGWWTTNGVWELGVPTGGPGSARSPVNCIGTVLDGKYPAYTSSRLMSPVIDLKAGSTGICFRYWSWSSYYNEPHTSDDKGQVEVQALDNGVWSGWDVLQTISLSSNTWTPSQIDLTPYAGKQVRVCFHHFDYHASGGGQSSGWFIDDVEIEDGSGTPPEADIKANGHDGNILINTGGTLDVTIELDAGTQAGRNAELWVGILTLNGAYYCVETGPSAWKWSTKAVPYTRGPLASFPETTVLSIVPPAGLYTAFFIVDAIPDGKPDIFAADLVNVWCR